jgi:hypothetical protein
VCAAYSVLSGKSGKLIRQTTISAVVRGPVEFASCGGKQSHAPPACGRGLPQFDGAEHDARVGASNGSLLPSKPTIASCPRMKPLGRGIANWFIASFQ